MPVGPLVSAFRALVVQMISDPAARELGGHLVGRPVILPRTTAGREMDVATRHTHSIVAFVTIREPRIASQQ